MAGKCLAFIAGLFILGEKLVETVALMLEIASFFVSAVSSLFHGSAPVFGEVWRQMVGWPWE